MPIWTTLPVDDQPDLTLDQWSIRELPDGDFHLVGWCLENREGRVSSELAAFDIEQLAAVTTTGRRYALNGHPGANIDAEYTWNQWAATHGVTSFVDVSRVIWAKSARGREAAARWSARASKGVV